MNKKGNVGLIIFLGAMAVFTLYCLLVYIPAITKNMNDSDALMKAVWWGVVCGIIGVIGLLIGKK